MMRLAIGSESAITSPRLWTQGVSDNACLPTTKGPPSKAWASGHPVILTEFANSCFKRIDVEIYALLTAALVLPPAEGLRRWTYRK
jgi:hypothetical protein